MPLDFQGVPQHRLPIESGRMSPIPAFSASDWNATATPSPPSAGPNIVPMHAWKYTASATPVVPDFRLPPPFGRSFDQSGSTSVPTSARATLLGAGLGGGG